MEQAIRIIDYYTGNILETTIGDPDTVFAGSDIGGKLIIAAYNRNKTSLFVVPAKEALDPHVDMVRIQMQFVLFPKKRIHFYASRKEFLEGRRCKFQNESLEMVAVEEIAVGSLDHQIISGDQGSEHATTDLACNM